MSSRSQHGHRPKNRFQNAAPGFAMPALRGVNNNSQNKINWNQHSKSLSQVSHQVTAGEKLGKREYENGYVKEHHRVSQISYHLPRELCPRGVIVGEQPETRIEPAALFARLE